MPRRPYAPSARRRGMRGGGAAAGAVLVALVAVAGCASDGEPDSGTSSAAPAPARSTPADSATPGGPVSDSPAPRDTPRDPARDRDLLDAAERGDADAVRAALDAGARVEARDDNRRTPLLLAALGDHVDAARPLVAAGADPDAQDDRSDSAWLVTGVTGSAEMGRLLRSGDRAPDLTLTNRFGGTSLIPASERGHVAYVRWITEHTDMDVNHVNDLGWTALLEAVILGDGGKDHQEIVALLLAADADPDIADKDGVTPLQHANNRGFTEIAALLDNA
ncbi:hypothetical protein GCM10010400_61180 [Streptomyces aculeolatus]